MSFLIVRGLDAADGLEVWKIKELTLSSGTEYFTAQRNWLGAINMSIKKHLGRGIRGLERGAVATLVAPTEVALA